MERELQLLWTALALYVAAGCLAIVSVIMRRRPERSVLTLIVLGLVVHGLSIGLRWARLGHGPFVTMFEILSSNIWSLTFVFVIAYWRFRPVRPIAAVVMPILFLMMGWLLVTSPRDTLLPATYDTVWLYIHIGFGKVFLGSVLVAVGMAVVILLRGAQLGVTALAVLPDNASLDELAYRFMALGLVFDTLMLIAGAIWAQDAWGRYWSWDPLETWAFLTWLLLAFAIHLRLTLKLSPVVGAGMVLLVFALAFLTFFGIPFISQAPHKGAV